MSVSLHFSLSPEQAIKLLEFYCSLFSGADDPQPIKRTRRTKEQMEADRTAYEKERCVSTQDDPAPRRRRRRESEADTGPEAIAGNLKRGRRRREGAADPIEEMSTTQETTSTTKSPSDDDISDADVARKASEGAQELTPAVVTILLEEFGVSIINGLDQEQRHEFFARIDEKIAEAAIGALEGLGARSKRRRRKK